MTARGFLQSREEKRATIASIVCFITIIIASILIICNIDITKLIIVETFIAYFLYEYAYKKRKQAYLKRYARMYHCICAFLISMLIVSGGQ